MKNMKQLFHIDRKIQVPVYQQIIDAIIAEIENGEMVKGNQIPSINRVAEEYKIARETVVKAFKILQEKGIIYPIRGKGYFVSYNGIKIEHRVFILLDTLSPYKQKMYESLKKTFGPNAYLDIYFHHYNITIFQKLIDDAAGNYTSYIILPFANKKVAEAMELLPKGKVKIIDQKPDVVKDSYSGIYQDFGSDVYSALSELYGNLLKYQKLTLVYRSSITLVPKEIKDGFERYCNDFKINNEIVNSIGDHKPSKGESFLVIDDEDLVALVEYCTQKNWEIGKDIGILSYNETTLKKVVAGGISVISTDFELMGKSVAQMIINSNPQLIANPCKVIDRNSF